MEDVSDPPFRAICKEQGADMMYTEFIAADGLIRNIDRSVQKLDIYPEERPIGIQIFGNNIDSMRQATEIVEQANPDLIDINYGCPVKKIVSKGAGAGILLDLPKMQSMAAEIVKQTSLPVTVKMRLGFDRNNIVALEAVQRLQDVGIQAVTIHGRTRADLYRGEANWDYIAEVKHHPSIHIPIFGNGDINSPEKALAYKKKYGVDGIMIGRAAIGNPWIFRDIKHYVATGKRLPAPSLQTRVDTIRRHLTLSVDWKGVRTTIFEMRRHYASYLRGILGAKRFRQQLVQASDLGEIEQLLDRLSAEGGMAS